jgi:hypothetical protein
MGGHARDDRTPLFATPPRFWQAPARQSPRRECQISRAHSNLVFVGTTSLYFEGAGGKALGRRGFSRDNRPELERRRLAMELAGDVR